MKRTSLNFMTSPWALLSHGKQISIATALSLIAISMTSWSFYKSNFYVRDSIKALAIGGVDAALPANEQDRIDLSVGIVNAGTRQASVLQAELVAAFREPAGGYSWVRIFPPTGQGFQAIALNGRNKNR
jgi:hypothetical protein